MEQSSNAKYGLIELALGNYFDKKMNQNLALIQNYVEASGDDFQKQFIAMILYRYEGGKNRSELASEFVEYAEDNLELIEQKKIEDDPNKDAIEVDSKVVGDKTYYATKSDKIFLQTKDREKLDSLLKERVKEMEADQNRDLSFTVYVKDGDFVFHEYHAWLSSGDGCCHFRSFSPKKDRTDYFNENVK